MFQAYHITNKSPIEFWSFLSQILVGLGYPAPKVKLPFFLVYFVALLIQLFVIMMRPIRPITPTFTPMVVTLAAKHHYYNCDRASKDFGYAPAVPLDDAIQQTLKSFQYLKNKEEPQLKKKEEPKKE